MEMVSGSARSSHLGKENREEQSMTLLDIYHVAVIVIACIALGCAWIAWRLYRF